MDIKKLKVRVFWKICFCTLLLASGTSSADTAYGLVNVWATAGTDPTFANTFMIQLKIAEPAGTGTSRCYLGLLTAPLAGDANKAMYATIVSAVSTMRPIAFSYSVTSTGTFCTVTQVNFQ
jgi:hypothetical protein